MALSEYYRVGCLSIFNAKVGYCASSDEETLNLHYCCTNVCSFHFSFSCPDLCVVVILIGCIIPSSLTEFNSIGQPLFSWFPVYKSCVLEVNGRIFGL